MTPSPDIADRLGRLLRQRNRELAADAAAKALLGALFSLLVFGFVFWISWLAGIFVGGALGLRAWQLGLLVTGVFFVVALWSAWRHVDPLADLERLSDRDMLLTLISQATPGIVYFSPRHALAGFAVVLLGGPANLVEALGIWAHRIRADEAMVDEAARCLALCEAGCPPERIREPAAALLLRRLALIKIVSSGPSVTLTLTDKGIAALHGRRSRQRKARQVSSTELSRDSEE